MLTKLDFHELPVWSVVWVLQYLPSNLDLQPLLLHAAHHLLPGGMCTFVKGRFDLVQLPQSFTMLLSTDVFHFAQHRPIGRCYRFYVGIALIMLFWVSA
jgi:hypothetical protein